MALEPVIEFKDFSFRYKTQNEFTLFDINLTIYKGEKVLILGPSGSGKSTLGNCINGLIPFSYDGEIKGSCKVSGIETKEANIFTISNRVGTVLQDSDAQFVGLSVGEDIAFSLENDAVARAIMLEQVKRTANIVGMQEFLEALPYSLSGGQKQKVALAGIMHNDVDTLLFDEPLAALDPAMGMTAIELIDDIQKEHGKTVVIIEHRLEDVLHRHVDRIILLNEGRIVMDTTPEKLLALDTLKQNGIREPLFIAAFRLAGVSFDPNSHFENVVEMGFESYKDAIRASYKEVPVAAGPGADGNLPTGNSDADNSDEDNSNADNSNAGGEVIVEADHVSFAYKKGQPVLTDVSFKIRRGEKIAIVGKNGAGKSTMAKLICGIARPTEGSIKLLGEDYKALSIREIGRMVGYVMQNPNQMLVKDIIIEEVRLALELNGTDEEVIKERVEKVLRMTDLYPMRNWPVGALSYGQKKRVTIASILVLQPDVIIFDEPTAGQDYKRYTEIMTFIDDLSRDFNITVLFITHDMHLAVEYTDRAIVFADGQLIADDAVFKVMSNEEVIERANLKQTSLIKLAKDCDIDPEKYLHFFIEEERRERANG